MMNNKYPISVDVLALLVLIPAHTRLQAYNHLIVLPFLAYLLLELWHPLEKYSNLPRSKSKGRVLFLIRLTLLLVIIAGATILPLSERLRIRSASTLSNSEYLDTISEVHDGALQLESALKFLSTGKNPYTESYKDTPIKYFGFKYNDTLVNPAWDSFVYLPGLLVISYPPFILSQELDLFYDQRIIWLFAYIFLVLIVPLLFARPVYKLLDLALIGLNPLLTGPVIHGMNDVIVILAIVLSVWSLLRKRIWLSILFIGLACILKQSAWFIFPFYLAYMLGNSQRDKLKQNLAVAVGIFLILVIIFIIPFLIWDAKAFLTDVLAYPVGTIEVNYPIRGYTLGIFLVGVGIIDSLFSPFPFLLLQAVVGIPLLIILIRRQLHCNELGLMLVHSGIFIFVIGFFSRFFQDNYFGMVTILISLGIVLDWARRTDLPKRSHIVSRNEEEAPKFLT